MISLENDTLNIDFSSHCRDVTGSLSLIRTLRLPDDGNTYPLPAGLGKFHLRHIEDGQNLPSYMLKRGGVMLPIYQAEALWFSFKASFPIALKIGCGKINAISGKPWSEELSHDTQDYIVIPNQPWLDGFSVGKGTVRQFVAMPLGMGMTVEEQLTEKDDVGGIQIIAYPMTVEAYEKLKQKQKGLTITNDMVIKKRYSRKLNMGITAGAKISQKISQDPYSLDSWDQSKAVRCFVHLLNSESWHEVTGEKMPRPPITPAEYEKARLPWFEYYSDDESLEGSEALDNVKSIGEFGLFKQDTAFNQPIKVSETIAVKANNATQKITQKG